MIKNFKKLPSTVAITLALTATIAVPTFATDGIDGSAAGANRTQSDVIDTTQQPSAMGNSDTWEVTLYFKNAYQGNGLMNGPIGMGQIITLGGSPVAPWIDSGGEQLTVDGPVQYTFRYVDDSPLWSAGASARSWGIEPINMKDKILDTVHTGSGIYGSTYDFMCRMIDDCCSGELTYEEIKGKMDSGEYFKFFVSMRPHLPVYIPANKPASLSSGTQYITRERLYNAYHNAGWATKYYFNMYNWLCNPWFTDTQLRGTWGQPDDWTFEKRVNYGLQNGVPVPLNNFNDYNLNYIIFWFDPLGQEYKEETVAPPTVETPPPPKSSPYKSMTLYSYELVAGFAEQWDPDDPTNHSLKQVETDRQIGQITIWEKCFNYPIWFYHQPFLEVSGDTSHGHSRPNHYCTSSCYRYETEEYYCSDDDCDDCPHEYTYRVYTSYHYSSNCHSHYYHDTGICWWAYYFKWTPNPTGGFDRNDLEGIQNVNGLSTNIPNTNNYQMNRYEITGIDGSNNRDLDLEINGGQVFNTWKWVNKEPGGIRNWEVNGTAPDPCDPSNDYQGDQPLPFDDPFTDEFWTHRHAKYQTPNDIVTGNGEELKIIPLAGYMFDKKGLETLDNNTYVKWSDPRQIDVRVLWYASESEENNNKYKDLMYKGTQYPVSWGHGGDNGTSTGDSDLIWPNEWEWARREDHLSSKDMGHNSSQVTVNHNDLPMNENGQTANKITTPRAIYNRQLIIEDTLTVDPGEHTHNSIIALIRKNEYGNERITFQIPSTIFKFSPTYNMYADILALDSNRDMSAMLPVWVLSTHVDTMQFEDIIDINLLGCESIVKSRAWSNDFEDRNVEDPNGWTNLSGTNKIQVLKSGDTYNVETGPGKLEVTGIIHYWDENFWNFEANETYREIQNNNVWPDAPTHFEKEGHKAPTSNDEQGGGREDTNNDNQIVAHYEGEIRKIIEGFVEQNIGFYSNLPGATGGGPDQEAALPTGANGAIASIFSVVNRACEGFDSYTHPVYNTTMQFDQSILKQYAKLRLTTQLVNREPTMSERQDIYRANGRVDGWNSKFAIDSNHEEYTDALVNEAVDNIGFDCVSKFKTQVLGAQEWLKEDYEGLMAEIVVYSAVINQVRSNDAMVYEETSDFQSSLNQWSPEYISPNVAATGHDQLQGNAGDDVLIPEGSVGAGMVWRIPDIEVYKHGIDGEERTLSNWVITTRPYMFGVRGSTFDK